MKTILISGGAATGKTELAKKIAENYNHPQWCSVNERILKRYYSKKLTNSLFDNINETTDLIIIDDVSLKNAIHIIKVFEYADYMIIKRKNYPDIVIDVPDLMVITNGNAKRSIQE